MKKNRKAMKCEYPGCNKRFTPKSSVQKMGPVCSKKYKRDIIETQEFARFERQLVNSIFEDVYDLSAVDGNIYKVTGNPNSQGGSGLYFKIEDGLGLKLFPYYDGIKGLKLDYFFSDEDNILLEIINECVALQLAEKSGLTPEFKNLRLTERNGEFFVAICMSHIDGIRVEDSELSKYKNRIKYLDKKLKQTTNINHGDFGNNYNVLIMPNGKLKCIDLGKATYVGDKEGLLLYKTQMLNLINDFYHHFLVVWNNHNPKDLRTWDDVEPIVIKFAHKLSR